MKSLLTQTQEQKLVVHISFMLSSKSLSIPSLKHQEIHCAPFEGKKMLHTQWIGAAVRTMAGSACFLVQSNLTTSYNILQPYLALLLTQLQLITLSSSTRPGVLER